MNIGEYYYFRIRKVMNVYQTRYPEKYKALYNEIMNAPIGEYGRMDTLIYMIIVKNLMKNIRYLEMQATKIFKIRQGVIFLMNS